MWLIPFSPGLDHVVTICFDRAQSIAGLRFWNYNKSPEDTYRGVSGHGGRAQPLSRDRRLDEWLVWLPERSINPPEPSKWPQGLQPGREGVEASFCRQRTQPQGPGQTWELAPCLSRGLGVLRPSPQLAVFSWAPLFIGRFGGQALAKGFSGSRHFIGRPSLPLGGEQDHPVFQD